MNRDAFIENLRIKDTILDRRYKLTKNQHEEISNKFKNGKTVSEIAKEYQMSYAGIKSIVDPVFRFKKVASKRAWYYNMSLDKRSKKSKEWKKSTKEYKTRIYNAFVYNNI